MRALKPHRLHFCLFLTVICFTGCWSYYTDNSGRNRTPYTPVIREEAYVPIYGYDTSARTIVNLPPQPIKESGKIYVFGNYLFQVENRKGVHVIDYSNPSKPVKISFIKSFGASEVAVKNGYMITNNKDDLVTIDISNLEKVKEVARVRHAFSIYHYTPAEYQYPPQQGKYFVCIQYYQDKEVIGWKLEKNVNDANCYY